VFDRLDHAFDVSLKVGRADGRQLDLASGRSHDFIERIDVISIAIPHQEFSFQFFVLKVNLEVASLLSGPIARGFLGAR
jgi:hypothetical protein